MWSDDKGPGSDATPVRPEADRLTLLAFIMVVVALMGAYVAYKAALAEHDAAQLERTFAQGHLIAMTARQELLDQLSTRAVFDERINANNAVGRKYVTLAAEIDSGASASGRGTDTASALRQQAQEEFAAADALVPYQTVLRNPADDPAGIESMLQHDLSRQLSHMGFDVAWRPQAADERSLAAFDTNMIWAHQTDVLALAHQKIPLLARGVVLFVWALVMFTLCDISRSRWFVRGYFAAGVAVTAAATFWIWWSVDAAIGQWLWAGVALVALLSVVGWRFPKALGAERERDSAEPDELAIRAYSGLHMRHRRARDPLERWIVGLIAGTVLASAAIGWLYSRAESAAGEAATTALRYEVEMHSRASLLWPEVGSLLQMVAKASEFRARETSARQRGASLVESGRVRASEWARSYAESHAEAAVANPVAETLLDSDIYGSWVDPHFPERLVREGKMRFQLEGQFVFNRFQSFAMWDGSSLDSLAYHRKAGVFLGTLTVFAIALYLLGQAYSIEHRIAAFGLVIAGVALVAAASGWALFNEFRPIRQVVAVVADGTCEKSPDDAQESVPDSAKASNETLAAYFYALSQIYSVWAYDPAAVTSRRDALQCVVKYRPDFSVAQIELAATLAQIGTSQRGEGYTSLPTLGTVPDSIAHNQAALAALAQNGFLEPPRALNSLGFGTLLQGFLSKGKDASAHIDASVDLFTRAAAAQSEIDPSDASEEAVFQFNLAIALRARGGKGDEQAADRIVDAELERLASDDPDLIVSTMTDLNILARYCGNLPDPGRCAALAGRIRDEIRPRLVAKTWCRPPAPPAAGQQAQKGCGPPPTPASAPTLEAVDFKASPDKLTWSGTLAGFDPARDWMAVIWYEYDFEWQLWHALPAVSGSIRELADAKDAADATRIAAQGIARSYLAGTSFGRCLGAGPTYRAEFYINGKRVGSLDPWPAPAKTADERLRAARMIDVNLGLCEPGGWARTQLDPALKAKIPPDRQPWSQFMALRGSSGKTSLFVAMMYEAPPGAKVVPTVTPAMQRSEAGADPSEPAAVRRAADMLKSMGLADGTEPFVLRNPTRGCDDAMPVPAAVYRTWVTAEGTRYIAVAFTRNGAWAELCPVLDSVSEIY